MTDEQKKEVIISILIDFHKKKNLVEIYDSNIGRKIKRNKVNLRSFVVSFDKAIFDGVARYNSKNSRFRNRG